ncbi:TonB-dependent receptor [Gelidibacter salicanalis]|uniref:TonB-dependent receptor n=1 Tax=Gelidibacter salicanalis TaxID=291193 RepID=A0A934KYB5_9FLAO|nr:TonB-dependent receptor [Gelidibacter salicanalis]MBJ7882822.1 TonB-dependent receptor [Gelidibacter salicanalis]
MKKLLLLLTLIGSFVVNAQNTGTVSGLITDAKGMPLSGATVSIKVINKGAMTDFDGKYTIENVEAGTYNVSISYIGYETSTKNILVTAGQTTQVDVSLNDSDTILDEIILTANKKPQKITDVPATVNVITAREIEEFPSFNIGELAARQKGVDFVRTGVLGTGINIRGFNSAFNSKNLQITDDRLSSLIATGLPLGSFSTVTKDDIERVEILLGPNGTLYGPNAHNGLVSTITKNPRTSEGTTFAIGAGNQNVLTARLRHAQIIDDKFAYKFHFERSQGTEFDYVDSVYVGTKAYKELDLDRDFDSQKYGASLYYKPTKGSELSGYYGHSNSNNIGATNAGRNQIKDWSIDVAQLKFVSKNFFANTYYTWSKTDDTYAMNQRTQNYVSFIENGFTEQEARERSYTEQWLPTGEGTGVALQRGAVFKDASNRFNAEAQYNNNWDEFYLTFGAQYQLDMADSKGTYLLDDGGIDLAQTGVYTQIEYKLEDSGWGFLFGARLDNHDLYGSNFIPKAAITKKVNNGTFRITYGKGIAVPSILNLKGNLFGGLVLGNGEGFTLKDGTKIAKLDVETINSYEIGYKGKLSDKLFIDTNAYYNQSDNFISPLVNVAGTATGNFVTHVGDRPIGEVIEGSNGAFVLTYLNFGHVDTYGLDVGLNYYFSDSFRTVFNYSYFDRDLDLNDMANDGNLDGKVLESELPINTPNHKFSLGFHYNQGNFYGSIFGRYVQKYDFFSGINVAAKTQDQDGDGVNEIVENARVGRTWNYGQLGGFTVDANAGYNFSDSLSLGMSITNLFNADVREFVASPAISTLISFELKYKINFFKNKATN